MTALKKGDVPGFTPRTLDVRAQLAEAGRPLASRDFGSRTIDVLRGRDTI